MKKGFVGIMFLSLILSSCGCSGYPNYRQTFTVIWENYDGTILEKDTEVPRGSWPEYNGRTPQKKSDEQYSYSFYTWSPQLDGVYKDITYVAQYKSQLEKAKIVFDLDGGTTNHATVPVYSSTISASDFFFDVTKPNYSFRGWQYNGTLAFDQFGNKLSNLSIRETMTFVASYSQNVFLSITKNIEEAGDVYGTGTYDYYSRVELFASPNEGYTFDGWYYKNIAISYQPNLTYTVDTTDINIEARFSLSYYRLEIESVHPSLGSVAINDHFKVAADGANIKYKSDVLVSARSSTEEYSFLGWYDVDGKLVSPSYVYIFQMPNHDYNLFAKWDAPSYRVSINKNRENGGTVTGAGMYGYSASVTVSQTTNPGYSFDGWYIDGAKKGQLDYYRFNMPANNVSITASWVLVTYNVTYNLDGGKIDSDSNPKTYTVEDNIILNSPSKTGYTFKCWIAYIESKSKEITALGNGMAGDVTVKAVWTPIEYSIPLYPNGGELDETVFVIRYDDSYVLPTPTRLGYKFDGWKGNSGLVSQSGTSWKYTDVTSLTAQWSIINYSITYELNGGTNNESNPTSYVIGDSFVLRDPYKNGYSFLGWFINNQQVTEINSNYAENIYLEAKWSPNKYTLSVSISNTNNGTVQIIEGSGYCGEQVTVQAIPNNDCVFLGWYNKNKKISNDIVYTFIMPASDYDLTAKVLTKEEKKEEEYLKKYATKPIVSDDGSTITYGLYPQDRVKSTNIITALNNIENPEPCGWYLYNEEFYTKVVTTSNRNYEFFSDGTPIGNYTTHWFKCTPITWNIVSNNDGLFSLLSSDLLDMCCFSNGGESQTVDGESARSNNYRYSSVRSWLNNDFYNQAFHLNNSFIQTSLVDNSETTTNSKAASYTCEDTEDKVYINCYQDLINGSLFHKTTDYVRAKGAYSAKTGNQTASYWTRSPASGWISDICCAYCKSESSGLTAAQTTSCKCVCPMITIKIV